MWGRHFQLRLSNIVSNFTSTKIVRLIEKDDFRFLIEKGRLALSVQHEKSEKKNQKI